MSFSGHVSKRTTKSRDSWGFRIELGPNPLTGRRRRRTRWGFSSEKEAERAFHRELTELESGASIDPTTMTVADVFSAYHSTGIPNIETYVGLLIRKSYILPYLNLVERLLTDGCTVVGIDDFDDFYDPKIKRRNIASCLKNKNFKLIEADIRNSDAMDKAIDTGCDIIVHLAARAGVRPSIANPLLYADVNVNGTMVLLEAAKKHNIKNFIFYKLY